MNSQPKTHVVRFRQVDRQTFLDIKSGRKTVETRAATTKYQNYLAGDQIKAEKIYYSFPGYKEKIAKFGLVAFFLEN